MPTMTLKTRQDVEDFVRGCAFYGTGGGGLPKNGLESLLATMEKGIEIGWVDVNDVPDNAITACAFLMGSIAPRTPEVLKEMERFGLTESVYKEKERLGRALLELSEYTGKKIEYVVPIERGGANTPGPIAAGLANGIKPIDGDYTGRAIPEIPQTTPYLFGKKLWPITSVDEWGNVSIVKEAINYAMSERIGKLISAAAYGLAGDAGFLMTGKETKEVIIPGSLTECYNVGKMIRQSRETGKDPVKEIASSLGGWILIKGKVTKKEWEDKLGYYWGTHEITGEGEYAGNTVKIWFKNENHICWKNDKVLVTSPDIITVVDAVTGEPYANPEIKEGDRVAVLGLKSPLVFRSEKGIEILGPKAFGFEYEYVPIEKTMK